MAASHNLDDLNFLSDDEGKAENPPALIRTPTLRGKGSGFRVGISDDILSATCHDPRIDFGKLRNVIISPEQLIHYLTDHGQDEVMTYQQLRLLTRRWKKSVAGYVEHLRSSGVEKNQKIADGYGQMTRIANKILKITEKSKKSMKIPRDESINIAYACYLENSEDGSADEMDGIDGE